MRRSLFFVAVLSLGAVATLANACGGDAGTSLFDGNGEDGGADTTVTPPPGFTNDGSTESGPIGSCVPRTCAQIGAGCGKQADGCGGVVDCDPAGGCPTPQTCGGGGTPSQCGGNNGCVPKTCQDLGAGCGQQGDGCGKVIDCDPPGGCPAPQFCGGGGASKCGVGTNDGGVVDGGVCVARTCAQANANCGLVGDGCGKLINCGLPDGGLGCTSPEICGGGGPNKCGGGTLLPDGGVACKPKTCADFPAGTCGPQGDGCGGLTANCTASLPGGACPPGTICGGGGVASQCGSNVDGGGDGATCTGLCLQQQPCDGGTPTTLTGTVYAPNGVEPVPGAIVYVPNCPVQPFTANVACDVCGALQSGCPLTTATTAFDGTFTLTNVPAGTNGGAGIPLVIQLGRWRRQITIPNVPACQTTALTDAQTHLPTRSTASIANGACAANATDSSDQGDIPLMAMATGSVDGLECVLRKIGINDCEFTSPASVSTKPGRVRFYIERGPTNVSPGPGPNSTTGNAPDWGDPTRGLINRVSEMKLYDMILFACEGGPDSNVVPVGNGTSAAQQNLVDYTTAGGRVYTTHYSYTWLTNIQAGTNPPFTGPAPFSSTGVWNIDQANSSPQAGVIDTTAPDGGVFVKGSLFAQWLGQPTVNALCNGKGAPCTNAATPPEILIDTSRHDMNGVNNPPAERWIRVAPSSPNYPNAPQHYTFNTPLVPADGGTVTQCGRVLYSDMHVHDMAANPSVKFPAECDSAATKCTAKGAGSCPLGTHATTSCNCGAATCCKGDSLTPSERILEFMLFDLASCITQQAPPPPPTCTTQTCAQLGVQCGLSGDGCGGTQQCPPCPPAQTCGGGGVPNQCGAPSCTKTTCAAQGANCGLIGDGCGGSLDCGPNGPCPNGTSCGGAGVPNQCGSGNCAPTTCAAQGAQCGPLGNGCGLLLDCGTCPPNQSCLGNKCVPNNCTPGTCPVNACGPIADGCGGLIDCGTCTAPQTCGGGGTPSQCGGGPK
jgi:hypothetical protein